MKSVYQDLHCSGFADGGMDIQVIDRNHLSFYLFKLIVLIEITVTSTIPNPNAFIALRITGIVSVVVFLIFFEHHTIVFRYG